MTVERLAFAGEVECRSAPDGGMRIGGYAAVFTPARSADLGGFVEQVDPHAFDESRARGWPDALCRFDHRNDMLLGTTGAKTLRLATDSRGLHYECDLPPSRRDVFELVDRGDVRGSSFSFNVPRPGLGDTWAEERGMPVRTLRSVQLIDASPVLRPAYADASVARRSLEEWRGMASRPGSAPRLAGADALARLDARRRRALAADGMRDRLAESRSALSSSDRAELPDSAFAYIEPGGSKDSAGRTRPDSLRHFPIHDAAHVRDALARIGQGARFADKAAPAVHAAAKRLGIGADDDGDDSRSYEPEPDRLFSELPPVAVAGLANWHANSAAPGRVVQNGKAYATTLRP